VDRTELSLLEKLQGIIERTYDLQPGVGEIGPYVIGDQGYRTIYSGLQAAGKVTDKVMSPSCGARTLLRRDGDGLAVSVYYPDSLIECLERNDTTRRLDDGNVDAFTVLVEELDHFLVIAERFRSGGAISLLDLELHANVTKYLMLKLFVGRMRRLTRLSQVDSAWIRFHLFEKGDYVDADPDVRARYHDASRFAARYVRQLDLLPATQRPRQLRRFHRMSPQAKIAHINGRV